MEVKRLISSDVASRTVAEQSFYGMQVSNDCIVEFEH
jgi:hypothetical protein